MRQIVGAIFGEDEILVKLKILGPKLSQFLHHLSYR